MVEPLKNPAYFARVFIVVCARCKAAAGLRSKAVVIANGTDTFDDVVAVRK